ncbi:MAG: aromatic-ring-hydroxylating dioxygenase subunit beta [Betaproteobacteria bacterium]
MSKKSGSGPDLQVRLRVEDLHSRYAQALDADRLEAWPGFFTKGGTYRVTTAENEARGLPLPVLYAEGRAMLRDRVASLRHANVYEPQRYRHIASSFLLEQLSRNELQSVSNFLVVRIMQDGESLLFASGRYLDRIVLSPEPLYAERVVVCDPRRFDTLLAIPL